MDGEYRDTPRSSNRDGFDRIQERLLDFIRTRTTEHWIMFLVGLVIGLALG